MFIPELLSLSHVLCFSECPPAAGRDGGRGEACVWLESGGGRAGASSKPQRQQQHQEKKMRRRSGLDGAVGGADGGAGARLPSEQCDGHGRLHQSDQVPQLHGDIPLHLPGDEKRQGHRLGSVLLSHV